MSTSPLGALAYVFLGVALRWERIFSFSNKKEGIMETYIILGNYTQEGVSKIKESPARIEAARKAIEAAGGKFLSWHLTLGRYDFLVIAQAPDAKIGTAVLLAIGAQGASRTETMRALTEEEFKEVVAGMP
jgi:uncharacterized protein with GYD domain